MGDNRYYYQRINELQSELDQEKRVNDYLIKEIWALREKMNEWEELVEYLPSFLAALEKEVMLLTPNRRYEPYLLGGKENPLTRKIEGRPLH